MFDLMNPLRADRGPKSARDRVRGPDGDGTYTVWSGMITVSTALGNKATQVDGSGSPGALDGLARIMLHAQDGKA
jgi:hypothetical protein